MVRSLDRIQQAHMLQVPVLLEETAPQVLRTLDVLQDLYQLLVVLVLGAVLDGVVVVHDYFVHTEQGGRSGYLAGHVGLELFGLNVADYRALNKIQLLIISTVCQRNPFYLRKLHIQNFYPKLIIVHFEKEKIFF